MNDGDQLYICEGIPDTITAMQMGLKAIGVLGASSFDSELVTMLLKYRIGVIHGCRRRWANVFGKRSESV